MAEASRRSQFRGNMRRLESCFFLFDATRTPRICLNQTYQDHLGAVLKHRALPKYFPSASKPKGHVF